MPIQRIDAGHDKGARAAVETEEMSEYPVREYIGAMALELAQMARWANDEPLARLLDGAAAMAADQLTEPMDRIQPAQRRPA